MSFSPKAYIKGSRQINGGFIMKNFYGFIAGLFFMAVSLTFSSCSLFNSGFKEKEQAYQAQIEENNQKIAEAKKQIQALKDGQKQDAATISKNSVTIAGLKSIIREIQADNEVLEYLIELPKVLAKRVADLKKISTINLDSPKSNFDKAVDQEEVTEIQNRLHLFKDGYYSQVDPERMKKFNRDLGLFDDGFYVYSELIENLKQGVAELQVLLKVNAYIDSTMNSNIPLLGGGVINEQEVDNFKADFEGIIALESLVFSCFCENEDGVSFSTQSLEKINEEIVTEMNSQCSRPYSCKVFYKE